MVQLCYSEHNREYFNNVLGGRTINITFDMNISVFGDVFDMKTHNNIVTFRI